MEIEDGSKENLDTLIEVMKSSGVKHMEREPEEKTKEMLIKDPEESKYDSIFDGYVF